jgi:two-component system, NtrC family, response regulator HydG
MSALKTTRGNREEAAKLLGIGTRTLYRKIKEYGL